jgi:hypothetical protein
MQPIYFPHTYITDETFQALSACFEKILVYQPTFGHIPEPMKQWQDAGRLEIRCPIQDLETDIESSFKAYQHFGNIHQGRKGELKNFQPAGIPFFEDTSTLKIQADLTRQIKEGERQSDRFIDTNSRLIHAGLFLQIAQEFDARRDEIRRGLEACAGIEKNLFKHLKEDDDTLFEDLTHASLPPNNPAGDHMLPERVSAWTRLFFHDILINTAREGGFSSPIFFITTSRTLFEEIVAQGGDHAHIYSLDSQKMDHTTTISTLTEIVKATDAASIPATIASLENSIRGNMDIGVIPEPPISVMSKYAGVPPVDVPCLSSPGLQSGTLLGLLSI